MLFRSALFSIAAFGVAFSSAVLSHATPASAAKLECPGDDILTDPFWIPYDERFTRQEEGNFLEEAGVYQKALRDGKLDREFYEGLGFLFVEPNIKGSLSYPRIPSYAFLGRELTRRLKALARDHMVAPGDLLLPGAVFKEKKTGKYVFYTVGEAIPNLKKIEPVESELVPDDVFYEMVSAGFYPFSFPVNIRNTRVTATFHDLSHFRSFLLYPRYMAELKAFLLDYKKEFSAKERKFLGDDRVTWALEWLDTLPMAARAKGLLQAMDLPRTPPKNGRVTHDISVVKDYLVSKPQAELIALFRRLQAELEKSRIPIGGAAGDPVSQARDREQAARRLVVVNNGLWARLAHIEALLPGGFMHEYLGGNLAHELAELQVSIEGFMGYPANQILQDLRHGVKPGSRLHEILCLSGVSVSVDFKSRYCRN